MKAIVTGASGFIGSQLVAELTKEGFQVAAIGRRKLNGLTSIRSQLLAGSTYLALDLDDSHQIVKKLRRLGFYGSELRFFFHLAWGGKSRLSDLDVDWQNKNITRTIETYEIADNLEADKYIFCGTMEESFAEAYTKLDYKSDSKYNRHVVYALAKISARNALKLRYKKSGPAILFGTNSHVMGPGDDKDSFLQVALGKILCKEEISMSSGDQLFDVINVKDCARAYIAIAKKGSLGSSYWIGSGNPRKLKQYVEEMNELFPSVRIQYGSMPFNDVLLEKQVFSTDRLIADTDFSPSTSFASSVTELATYLRSINSA